MKANKTRCEFSFGARNAALVSCSPGTFPSKVSDSAQDRKGMHTLNTKLANHTFSEC